MIDDHKSILPAKRGGEGDGSVGGDRNRPASAGVEAEAPRHDPGPVDRAESVEERRVHRQGVSEIERRKRRIAAHRARRGEIERRKRPGRRLARQALGRLAARRFERLPAGENAVARAKCLARQPRRARRSLGFEFCELALADGELLTVAGKLGAGRIRGRCQLAASGKLGGERCTALLDDRHGRIEQGANPDHFVDRAMIGERQERRLAAHRREPGQQ